MSPAAYFPKDCHLSPNRFMAGLKRQCDALGVKFIWNTEATTPRLETRADGTTTFVAYATKLV